MSMPRSDDQRLDGILGRSFRRSRHRQRLLDALVAVANQVMNHPLRLPANDRFQVGKRVFAAANRFSGLEGGRLKLLFPFAGFLPIFLCQLLKLRFCGLKLKVCHVLTLLHSQNHQTIGPANGFVNSGGHSSRYPREGIFRVIARGSKGSIFGRIARQPPSSPPETLPIQLKGRSRRRQQPSIKPIAAHHAQKP